MNTLIRLPFYAKASLLLVGSYVLISMLYITQGILLPIIYAAIIAVLLSPVVKFLVRKTRMKRALAVTLVLSTAIALIVVIIALLSSQASHLSDALPQFTDKLHQLLNSTILWASEYFNIDPAKIDGWLTQTKSNLMTQGGSMIGTTLGTIGDVLATTLLTPVYIFMLLMYQKHLIEFFYRLFGAADDAQIGEFLTETKTVIQGYLVGLLTETLIVTILNTIGLFILGIQYAIILGIVSGILNMIPYLGGLINMVMFAMIVLVTKSPIYVLYVVIMYSVIQFIDNNYIVPKIVGSRVQLNAFVSLLAVIFGAALWGVPGMFLSIPLMAILKLIFDRITGLKPWGFLLGDTTPQAQKIRVRSHDKNAKKTVIPVPKKKPGA